MSSRIVTLSCAVVVSLVATAAAASPIVPLQGYLENAEGQPIDDSAVAMEVSLYDVPSGALVFRETQMIAVEQGFFTVYLGEERPLETDIFRDYPSLWVGVRVGDDTEDMRFPLGLAPYAASSDFSVDAAKLGGKFPNEYALKNHTHPLNPAEIQGWAREACFDSESELRAALDDNYLGNAKPPLIVRNGAVTLATCSSGQVLKSEGAAWSCGVDQDTTYSARRGGGLELIGTSFGLSTRCSEGQLLKWAPARQSWDCAPDNYKNYTAGPGLKLSPTDMLYIAPSGVATSHLGDGAVTGAKVARDSLGMREINPAAGNLASTVPVALTGAKAFQEAGTLSIPLQTGTVKCHVTVTGKLDRRSNDTAAHLAAAIKVDGASAAEFGSWVRYPEFADYQSSVAATGIVEVPAGRVVQVGCLHGSGAAWDGDLAECGASYLCF